MNMSDLVAKFLDIINLKSHQIKLLIQLAELELDKQKKIKEKCESCKKALRKLEKFTTPINITGPGDYSVTIQAYVEPCNSYKPRICEKDCDQQILGFKDVPVLENIKLCNASNLKQFKFFPTEE